MANVSFANLTGTLYITQLANISSVDVETSTTYGWETTYGFSVVLSGTGFTYDQGDVTGGTVTQMAVDIGDGGSSDLVVTGLSFSLATLANALSGLSEEGQLDLLTRTIFGGADTVDFGSTANYVYFSGDGADVSDGETIDAGADTMSGSIGSDGYIVADFWSVNAGGTLHGGDDVVDVTSTSGGFVMGDAKEVWGTLFAGDDTVTLTSGGDYGGVVGDVYQVYTAGIVVGGDDTILIGDDTEAHITVNGDASLLYGTLFGGDDTISAGAGITAGMYIYGDTGAVYAGAYLKAGNDTISGGDGGDNIYGDVQYVDDTGTLKTGDDVVYGKGGDDYISGDWHIDYDATYTFAGGDDKLYGGDGDDYIFGNAGDDLLDGGSGGDYMKGGTGDDTLDGGSGIDYMYGGDGDDTYVVDNASDDLTESADEGTDLVQSSINWTLATNFENLTLTGDDDISGTGNAEANTITGNEGDNTLDGGAGDDVLAGRAGDDTYIVDSADDVIKEIAKRGSADTVEAKVSYTLSAGVYVETLRAFDATATTALDLTGNDLGQSISGNAGANILIAGAGNDTLNGLAGLDTLIGGSGKDAFVFDAVLVAGNVDTIDDFTSVDDTFHIDNSVFKGLKAGALSAKDFALISSATSTKGVDVSDRILYDKADGDLYFDRDGSGKKFDRVLFAHVDDGTQLAGADFFII